MITSAQVLPYILGYYVLAALKNGANLGNYPEKIIVNSGVRLSNMIADIVNGHKTEDDLNSLDITIYRNIAGILQLVKNAEVSDAEVKLPYMTDDAESRQALLSKLGL